MLLFESLSAQWRSWLWLDWEGFPGWSETSCEYSLTFLRSLFYLKIVNIEDEEKGTNVCKITFTGRIYDDRKKMLNYTKNVRWTLYRCWSKRELGRPVTVYLWEREHPFLVFSLNQRPCWRGRLYDLSGNVCAGRQRSVINRNKPGLNYYCIPSNITDSYRRCKS